MAASAGKPVKTKKQRNPRKSNKTKIRNKKMTREGFGKLVGIFGRYFWKSLPCKIPIKKQRKSRKCTEKIKKNKKKRSCPYFSLVLLCFRPRQTQKKSRKACLSLFSIVFLCFRFPQRIRGSHQQPSPGRF